MLIIILDCFANARNDDIGGYLTDLVHYPTLEALAEPAKNEPCETACRMAGTEIYDFEGED